MGIFIFYLVSLFETPEKKTDYPFNLNIIYNAKYKLEVIQNNDLAICKDS